LRPELLSNVQGPEVAFGQPEGQHSAPYIPLPIRSGRGTPKVLLLDGYSTRTLACVRSWGKHGIAFAVGGESHWDMSLFSRYSKEKFVYTSPKENVKKFIEDVNRNCQKFAADFVFPTSEAGIMACSQYRKDLTCVPLIPMEREIEVTFSKAKTLALAESLGIAVPKTEYITNDNVQTLDAIDLKFPVVIKSESSEVMQSGKTETSGKTAYAFTKADVVKECKRRLAKGQSVLVQEFIDGYGVGLSGLFAEGRPVALLAHRRIRESNPLGGPSALAETIELEPRLLEATSSLFKTLSFSGPAMTEFKIDRRTGQPYLMEINGRFWGTVLLAPAAGLDLPYLFWKMLNGIEIQPEETGYQVGIKGRYLVGDTKCLLLCLKGKPSTWPGEFPGRWSAVKSYSRSFVDKQTKDLLFTQDDPKPFFARLMQDVT
jgi:predicted ATP-grasp superfamily ATP-dependent carboligase